MDIKQTSYCGIYELWIGKRRLLLTNSLDGKTFFNEKLIDGNVEIDYVKSNTTLTNAKIIEMDSCEYIQYHVYFYEAITHRGRCKYCAERLKKALKRA